ncbi:MAG TPA: glycosyltransferase [Chitinophagaceae bacterium]|nr:glycosyltransferase [Chitinophagaceae bacterium]
MMKPVAIYIGRLSPERERWTLTDRCKFQWTTAFIAQFKRFRFVLISESEIDALFSEIENVETKLMPEYSTSFLSVYRHFNYRLSGVLKASDCQLFISLEGIIPKSYKGKSCLLIPDSVSNDAEQKELSGLDRYRFRYLKKMVSQADWVICQSQFTKKYLLQSLDLPEKNIHVMMPKTAGKNFRLLEWEEREKVKEQYSDGKEFLLYMGGFSKKETFVRLLKGLTVLKKKMNSGMVLVLSGEKEGSFKKFFELVRTYHFRTDLKFTGTLTENQQAELMGAAYACVIPSADVDFASPVLEMLQCLSPVIVPSESVHAALGQDAVSGFEKNDFEDLGDKLCELYRNENKRAALIRSAEKRAERNKELVLKPLFSELFDNLSKE